MQHDNVSAVDASGKLWVMPSVYSVAFTETNEAFDATHLDGRLWNVTATRSEFDQVLATAGLGPLGESGEKKLGLMDLIHEPILEGILSLIGASAKGIDSPNLGWRYPLHGSALGITYLMTHLKVVEGVDEICVLEGDYEGYAAQAANTGLAVRVCDTQDAQKSVGRVWFVSNPSAIDGEPLDEGLVAKLVADNRVVVDIAYHGICGQVAVTVPDGTWAALWSLSKPWGLFWRRVGILASSVEIPCAYGTRWYKDPAAMFAAWNVVRQFEPGAMADAYRWAQYEAIALLEAQGVKVHAASTLLLGRIVRAEVDDMVWQQVAGAERVKGSGIARVCLSPLIEQLIAAKSASEAVG